MKNMPYHIGGRQMKMVYKFIVASRVTLLLDQLWVLGQGSDKQKLHFSFVFQQWSGSRLFKGVKKGK